jgi:FAD-linked oxidoreductase
MTVQDMKRWRNWSGSVQARPVAIEKPASIDEVVWLIKRYSRSGLTIRVVGAGHSFTPLVQTDNVLVSLERLQGLVEVDHATMTATVWGGTRLKALGELLFAHGVAQENLGDINVQTIAGAISTGTHGTGAAFGSLATQVVGLTLVLANGDVVECSPQQQPELFKAAQVSLGALGIIVQVRLRVVPAKKLRYQVHRYALGACLTNIERLKNENTHFEYYWMPYTNEGQLKLMNETDRPISASTVWGTVDKVVMENWVYGALSELCRRVPAMCERVCALSSKGIASIDEVEYSHRLFTTPREVRFQEMEYNIPAQSMPTVLQEIKDCIDEHRFRVHFPIECRFVHSDDIWLSPAYERESAYIAVHMYKGMPYRDYFYHIEQIFKRHQGRPHWGKLHLRTTNELAELYPRWHDFRRIRDDVDPHGIFLNDYLRSLFGASILAHEPVSFA